MHSGTQAVASFLPSPPSSFAPPSLFNATDAFRLQNSLHWNLPPQSLVQFGRSTRASRSEPYRVGPNPCQTCNMQRYELAPQNYDGQILPESVTDEELSFQSRQCLTPAKAPLSSERLPSATIEPTNRSPPKRDQRSRRKPQNHKHYKRERDNTRNNLRVDEGASSTPGNPAVSPATSLSSTNSRASRGGRPKGYHLPEQDRRNAGGVRRQVACFRCWSLREKVGSISLPVSAKLRLIVGQSAHMDILPARIAGGSTSTANSGIG